MKLPLRQQQRTRRRRSLRKKKGLFRWWGLGLLLGVIGVTIAGAELGFSYTVRSILSGALTDQNFVMHEESELGASLLGGSVAIDNLKVDDVSHEEISTPYQSDELRLDMATFDSLFGSDYVIERLASRGTQFDFRRRSDGSIPGIPAVKPAEGRRWSSSPVETSEEQDLVTLFEVTKKRWEQLQEYGWVLDHIPGGSDSEGSPAVEWKNATYYAPSASEKKSSKPAPRVIIRDLALKGDGLQLPNKVGEMHDGKAALDISYFEVSGQNISLQLLPDETMKLVGEIGTNGAGVIKLDLNRSLDQGQMELSWTGFPLPLLNDPQLTGKHLGEFKAQGSVDLALVPKWDKSGALSGSIPFNFKNLDFNQGNNGDISQASQQIQRLGLDTITWELPLTGTVDKPRIDGFSFEISKKALLKNAQKAAEEQARALAEDAIEEGKEEVKEAVQDELKNLLNKDDKDEDKSKDTGDRLKDAESSLKDRFGL